MAVVYKIFGDLKGSLFIIESYVGEVLKAFQTVGVKAHDRFFISLADSYAVVVQHTKQYQSVYVPGGYMSHDLYSVT